MKTFFDSINKFSTIIYSLFGNVNCLYNFYFICNLKLKGFLLYKYAEVELLLPSQCLEISYESRLEMGYFFSPGPARLIPN